MLETVTLDQLRMLVAIAEAGSFTAAAKRVNRAQSAVSHAMAMLEAHLGVDLFDRSARTPCMTLAGKAVLEDARVVLARTDRLKARAEGMASGLEAELTIAASSVVPQAAVVSLLVNLRSAFPDLSIRLFVEEIGGASQLVGDGTAELGIVGGPSLQANPTNGIEKVAIGSVEIVAIAAPNHPLARLERRVSEADLLDHRQLVPTSRVVPRYPNRVVQDVWEIADLPTRYAMLLEGVGWGTAPKHMADADIKSGKLVRIDVASRPNEAMLVPLFAIHRSNAAPGPAGRWCIAELEKIFSSQH